MFINIIIKKKLKDYQKLKLKENYYLSNFYKKKENLVRMGLNFNI